VKTRKTSPLSAEIFAVLKRRIICWEYPPGHRFIEEELCEEFGVSRSPVREALQMLAENGLVTKEAYRGYTVRLPDMEEVHELYDVRLALETYVVEWLATHGMPEARWTELYTIWQCAAQTTPEVVTDFAEMDEGFHEQLAECTGNRYLLHFLRSTNERLHFIRMTDITDIDRLHATCEQHLHILECIKKGDVQGAREAVRVNIEGGRQKVEHAFKEALSRAFQNHASALRGRKEDV
jgi:DNA-binding GntR family transcriptional regulator